MSSPLSWKFKAVTSLVILGGGAGLIANDYYQNYVRPYQGQVSNVDNDDEIWDPDLGLPINHPDYPKDDSDLQP